VAQTAPWPIRVAAEIGKRVAYYRERTTDAGGKRMTVQALADRCAELGLPLDRTVITKLEKGRRQSVTVPELLVLARALKVSPLMLIFPVGHADVIEVIPGHEMTPFQAAQWFSGEQPWPGATDAEANAWWNGSFAVIAYRDHAKLVADHRFALRAARNYRRTATEAATGANQTADLQGAASMYERESADIERQLRGIRKAMRDRGVTPPELPEHMKHIDCPNGDSAVPGYELHRPGSPGFPGGQPADEDS
jgi:hypothetical protein